MKKDTIFVGLDVHKNSIAIALAEEGREGEVRRYGTIPGDLDSLDKVVRKLVSKGSILHFVYEAGPCGYEIYRHLTVQGFDCMVVAPSMIPKKSGNRIKTDRRDAAELSRLYRAGELTPVYVPRLEDEAMRDLTRSREDAKSAERKARQRLSALLLRHGFRYTGRTNWSLAHFRWISDIKMPHPAQQFALQEYVNAIVECQERVKRLTAQIRTLLPQWRLFPVIKAFQALRGVSVIVAATTVAELGDLTRFESPRQLMAYLGLVPSEHSSGGRRRQGAITLTGNGHARRALVESAWSYRFPARQTAHLKRKAANASKEAREIAWRAQKRLCGRYRTLTRAGKNTKVACVAIARELVGFIWDIVRHEMPKLEVRSAR